jgi:hypothetical protein
MDVRVGTRSIAFAAAAVASLCTVPASAACFGYYCSAPIETMSIDDTAAYIRLVGGVTGLNSCTPYSGNYMVLYKTHASFKELYAVLVGAYLAKESVTLRPVEASTNCTILYIAVP